MLADGLHPSSAPVLRGIPRCIAKGGTGTVLHRRLQEPFAPPADFDEGSGSMHVPARAVPTVMTPRTGSAELHGGASERDRSA
jgi:hypothetical protein